MSQFKSFVLVIICLTFVISITSGIEISPVCTKPGDQMFPAISGNTIVWADGGTYSSTGYDIYRWDPLNGEQPVCTELSEERDPAISGDTIVWNDNRAVIWISTNGTR